MKQSRPLDASPEVERIQIECFRKMTPTQRLEMAAALTQSSRNLRAVGVRLRHTEYNEEQVRMAVIRLTIPEKLFLAAYPRAHEVAP